jgi:hypothetical protein
VRTIAKLVLALGLFAGGWALARAQSPDPDFAIEVSAPGGPTTIKCIRGCRLAWIQRGVNPNAMPTASFDFECTAGRCASGAVGGWLTR